ncbi:Maleylacetate reductase [Rubrobacter xylanophilus DSM 9941]|uniref:iron-containing alcohol dehydrogenase n=1 Tax=Rubrobacter xylanophilus TaxID=49319 RepID=UPI001C63F8E5|nr:iron-containing alcohol dehydrogenase [Rubrobacter xylanophilus]QYJ14290.1 Maleylacetate reductase [Rubrobacter xylanophilus DSM 9941]
MRRGTHTFLRTERVHFGAGSLQEIKEEARSADRAFVVTGRSLYEKTDLVRRVEALLGRRHAGTFAQMGQHTPGSAVERAAEAARGADLLVSVGGGSVIDGTKAVARELGYPRHIAVPTTLSGAEWGHRVGVTDEAAGRKAGFRDERSVPPVVVLDPEATVHTPERLWLSTGIRALDHAVEGVLYGGEHPVTDVTGLEGARRLMRCLPRSKREPEDLEVRGELQVAAWLAYFGPANTPMGLSHELGRRIGASYEIPHGITSCITLAPSLDVMRDRVPPVRWQKLADALGGDPTERVAALVEELGLPRRLRDFGVPEADLEEIAAEYGERAEDALAILRAAY